LRRIRPVIGVILALAFLTICFAPQSRTLLTLPEYQRMVVGESNQLQFDLPSQLASKIDLQVIKPTESVFVTSQDPPVVVNRDGNRYEIMALRPGKVNVQLKLLGYIPVKSMAIESLPTRRVVPGGHSIGVLLQSRGIMVVGFAPVLDGEGNKVYPARDKGIEIGDLVYRIDGQMVSSENELARIIDDKERESVSLSIKRRDKFINVTVEPILCGETGRHRIGLFVRDGIVGVGTLSFWDPNTREYAALGHIIVDADTRQGIDVLQGKIVSASIQTIKRGKPGQPGEKIGVFNGKGQIEGTINKNTFHGIYGKTGVDVNNPISNYTMEVGYAHQIQEGPAEIYTVVNGEDIERFNVIIEKVYPERNNGKGMIIRVTDPRLLNLSGGIVQGMSGSPIIQDSKIIGAVTHVFLNDPERGYGIFMDNMLSEMTDFNPTPKKVSTNLN
jgi:stage IV sporulation protein B